MHCYSLDNVKIYKYNITENRYSQYSFVRFVEKAIITAKNGNGFETVQENPAQKRYNTMITRYCSTIKQLQDLLPNSREDNINKAGEALAAFVTKGKPGDIH